MYDLIIKNGKIVDGCPSEKLGNACNHRQILKDIIITMDWIWIKKIL